MINRLLPIAIYLLSSFLALYNINGFPILTGDEGIYVSQAHWLSSLGELGPYTYWYDHFPLGWAQIGLWQKLLGPQIFFDNSVLSARVLMGLVLGGITTLIYLLTHHLTKAKLQSILASIFYICSPLTITFGRQVLLDNLATLWLLLSLYSTLKSTRILHSALSGLFLGIAILTKESLIFFIPIYLISIYYLNRHNFHRRYSILISVITLTFILCFYPLLAILKGEFWPSLSRVSLLSTIKFQLTRGSGLSFWQAGSHFRETLSVWLKIDPLYLALGFISSIYLLLQKSPQLRLLPLYSLSFFFFLARGGQIYDFYILPLLPLFALTTALVFTSKLVTKIQFATPSFIAGIIILFSTQNYYPLTTQATANQLAAFAELAKLPPSSLVVTNNYYFLDIYLGLTAQSAWYTKIESDVSTSALRPNITHLLVDDQFALELNSQHLPYLTSLYLTAKPLQTFDNVSPLSSMTKPYAHTSLTLYSLPPQSQPTSSPRTIISTSNIDMVWLQTLVTHPPFGILINSHHFQTTSDLELLIDQIQATLPTTQIFTIQDSEGSNSIPWINTPSRQYFKSSSEASLATQQKTQALQALDFDGAIIATSNNQDGYLTAIASPLDPSFTLLVRYTGQIPATPIPLVVSTIAEITTLRQSGYQGQIFLLQIQ